MLSINSCCNLTIFPLSVAPSNVYQINTNCSSVCGDPFATTHAYCDMDTDDGGWTVVQRNRAESEVSFDRNWTEYEEGFGDLQTEFWYGLKKLHCLTENGLWEMRVDYQVTADGPFSFIHYTHFSVGNSTEEYPLMVGGYTGTGTDQFAPHNMMKFTTRDNENDSWPRGNCAVFYSAGWWFGDRCPNTQMNLNKSPPHLAESLVFAEMKIHPKHCIMA